MALFNKLFSSRKKTDTKFQDNVCDKLFVFSNDQVRVVLYRECDFRGRKLLFDSQSVQKIPLSSLGAGTPPKQKFAETTDGFGYVYTKRKADTAQLGEMVFGSVAMSYRGTTYKIHSFSAPARIMCTQVFPSPGPTRGRSSMPTQTFNRSSTTSSSLEQSVRFDDSGTSSITSLSEQLSVNSSTSDTLLVCRYPRSIPLDVPALTNTAIIPNGDSGFSCEQLCSSLSSGPLSYPISEASQSVGATKPGFSCGSLYNKCLRSTTDSLEHSTGSLTGGSASADECFLKPHTRRSKLGLAVVIQLPENQEDTLEKFLMEHAVLMESMVWRARQGAEAAYLRHSTFVSLMLEMSQSISQFLVDLLSGPYMLTNLWLTLSSPYCDISSSIKRSGSFSDLDRTPLHLSRSSDVSDSLERGNEFTFLILTRLFKSEGQVAPDHKICSTRDVKAEKFVRELCELLEAVDVKHTNFFMSTLITAVLTHHLGWVATALPSSDVQNQERNENPLRGQLIDLFGAIGCPTKVSRTVVAGGNKPELITKILNSLTYFIRCNDVTKNTVSRMDTDLENILAEKICFQSACIPKEKKYEDHLRDIAAASDIYNQKMHHDKKAAPEAPPAKSKMSGLTKCNSCLSNLNEKINSQSLAEQCEKQPEAYTMNQFKKMNGHTLNKSRNHEILDKVTDLGLQASHKPQNGVYHLTDAQINENVHKICRVPTEAILSHVSTKEKQNLVDIKEASEQIKKVFIPKAAKKLKPAPTNTETSSEVLFLLGDDEKLVGINKEKNIKRHAITSRLPSKEAESNKLRAIEENEISSASTAFEKEFIRSVFKDCDFVPNDACSVKPSTSCNFLNGAAKSPVKAANKEFVRSQSMPPTENPEKANAKAKYRYSGVKFNFQQYPQIFANYMKSKNIELSNLPFSEKEIKFEKLRTQFDFSGYESEYEEVETLQTPSNATELEFTSEDLSKTSELDFSIEANEQEDTAKFKIVQFPMPGCSESPLAATYGYTSTLMRGLYDHYTSDMVLQGVSAPKLQWESALKRDLVLSTRHTFLDRPIEEAVAVVANTDTWEVQLMSSHTYVVDRGSGGVRVGMSQLVANMLESLLHMWKLRTPPEYCLMHIEQKLQEFCMRSKALAQLLLATEFCSMELLTSTLQLEINDVPLIMAIASTHTPQIMQKYGLSFQ